MRVMGRNAPLPPPLVTTNLTDDLNQFCAILLTALLALAGSFVIVWMAGFNWDIKSFLCCGTWKHGHKSSRTEGWWQLERRAVCRTRDVSLAVTINFLGG
jgi:hypothetical protein